MQAFVVFTFEKAVGYMTKSITTLKNDNLAYESWRLFKKYEGSPIQFKEDIYYNDFIRIIPAGGENEVYVRLGKSFRIKLFSLLHQNWNNYLSWVQF